MTSDESKGLYGKYFVERLDGSSAPGLKHHGCDYYVLDLVHDPYAVEALEAYASACADRFPQLAVDLRAKATLIRCNKEQS